jgi:chemotaxis protein histidine kinase CheA
LVKTAANGYDDGATNAAREAEEMQSARRACTRIALCVIVLSICRFTDAEPPARPKREPIGEVLGKPVYRDELHPHYLSSTEEDELHRLFLDPVLAKYVAAHRAELEPTKAELVAVEALIEKRLKPKPAATEAEIRKSLQQVNEELSKKRSEFSREYLEQSKRNLEGMLREQKPVSATDELEAARVSVCTAELKALDARLSRKDLSLLDRASLTLEKWTYQQELAHPYRTAAEFLYSNWKLQRHFYDHFGGGRVLWQQGGYEAFDAYRRWLETEERQDHFKITDPKLRQTFYRYWRQSGSPFLIKDADRIRAEFLEPDWVPRPDRR